MKKATDISGCGGRHHVGTYAINNVNECADAAKANSGCSNAFFYAPLKGWCKCEKKGRSSCPRTDSDNYEEYSISGTSKYIL